MKIYHGSIEVCPIRRRINQQAAIDYRIKDIQVGYPILFPYRRGIKDADIYRSKGGKEMNLEINQSNLYLLLPSKVAWMAEWLTEDKNVSIVEAIKMIYSSDMFRRLEDESTKMWHLGPVALYQELITE